MIGFMSSFFCARRTGDVGGRARAMQLRSQACMRASFQRGWSEQEVESLLLDRHVIAHRAMTGTKLAGFIMSRLVEDEAEILSVAVARRQRGRGLARQLLNLHLRGLPASARAPYFWRSTRTMIRRSGFISGPVFMRFRAAPTIIRGHGRQTRLRPRAPPRPCLKFDGHMPATLHMIRKPRSEPGRSKRYSVIADDKNIAEKKNIEALCAAKGMRMTEQRRVIARVLAAVRRSSRRRRTLSPLRQGRRPHLDLYRLPHNAAVRGCRNHRAARFSRRPRTLRDQLRSHHDHLINLAHWRSDRIPVRGNRAPAGARSRASSAIKLVDHRLELYAVPLDGDKKR